MTHDIARLTRWHGLCFIKGISINEYCRTGVRAMTDGGPDNSGQITKSISYVKDGLFAVYYCKNQEVASEICSQNGSIIHRSGTIPDGIVKEYYTNGTLRKSVQFNGGNENGLGVEYYPSGDLFEENNYKRGVLHGPSKTYRQDGTLWMEAFYKNGKLHGPFTSYHDNGSLENKAEYASGKLHGSYIAYDKQGFVIEEGKFIRGKKQGIYRVYHDTGHPSRVERYKQGILVSCEEFDDDGKTLGTTGVGRKYAGR